MGSISTRASTLSLRVGIPAMNGRNLLLAEMVFHLHKDPLDKHAPFIHIPGGAPKGRSASWDAMYVGA